MQEIYYRVLVGITLRRSARSRVGLKESMLKRDIAAKKKKKKAQLIPHELWSAERPSR